VTSETTYDFGDGYGAVPAHRHVNPDGTIGGWVADTAAVSPTATVGVDARVYDNAIVCGNARVYENSCVSTNAHVSDNAHVSGYAVVCGSARVYENAHVSGDAAVCGDAIVYGSAVVCGTARVGGDTHVFDTAHVRGAATVRSNDDLLWGVVAGQPWTAWRETDGQVVVADGCQVHGIDKWDARLDEIAKYHNLTHLVPQARATLAYVRAVMLGGGQ